MQELNIIALTAKAERKCGSGTSHLTKNWQSRRDVSSLVVRPNESAGAEFQIFGSPVKLEVWKQNFTSLTGPYPTDCHCQCGRITLLTAIIVIPSEAQCEDQVWLNHRTFAMLLTRSLCSRSVSG